MADKGWKQYERRIARIFSTVRNPLSGIMSRHTGSDTLHPLLYIEAKVRKSFVTVCRVFTATEKDAKGEGKTPVVIVKVPRQEDGDSLVVCRLADLPMIAGNAKFTE